MQRSKTSLKTLYSQAIERQTIVSSPMRSTRERKSRISLTNQKILSSKIKIHCTSFLKTIATKVKQDLKTNNKEKSFLKKSPKSLAYNPKSAKFCQTMTTFFNTISKTTLQAQTRFRSSSRSMLSRKSSKSNTLNTRATQKSRSARL